MSIYGLWYMVYTFPPQIIFFFFKFKSTTVLHVGALPTRLNAVNKKYIAHYYFMLVNALNNFNK